MLWRVCLLGLLVCSSAAAEPSRTPYDEGHFELRFGFYQQDKEVRGLRIGGGFFVARGLEVGLDVTHFWGQPADVEGVAPFLRYVFTSWYDAVPLVPYIGVSYEHRWTDPNYYVADSVTARAGLELTLPNNTPRFFVVVGGGVVVDHPIKSCPDDNCYVQNSDHIGPEVFATFGF